MLTYRRLKYIIALLQINMPVCRNWQTRQTQNLLSAMACGFESHHRHHLNSQTYMVRGFFLLSEVKPPEKFGRLDFTKLPYQCEEYFRRRRFTSSFCKVRRFLQRLYLSDFRDGKRRHMPIRQERECPLL